MRLKLFLFLLSGLFLLASCENEIDVNADWRDVPVVFCLLNIDDTEHFLRVSKVFLGEGDALAFAQNPDSIYYNPNDIEVKVEELINSNVARTWILEPRTDIAKEEGVFAYPNQILYSFSVPANNKLKSNATYNLTITNAKTGNVLTGSTKLVGKVNMLTPSSLLQTIDLYPQEITFVKWKTVGSGRLYEVNLDFIYREHPAGLPGEVVKKVVTISLGRATSDNLNGNEEIIKQIDNRVLYQSLASFIPASTIDNPMIRYADSLRFSINTGDDDLNTYLNVNQPSNTIAQERPQFNNVENGLGLFASRSYFKRTYYIGDVSVDSLRFSSVTGPINFQAR